MNCLAGDPLSAIICALDSSSEVSSSHENVTITHSLICSNSWDTDWKFLKLLNGWTSKEDNLLNLKFMFNSRQRAINDKMRWTWAPEPSFCEFELVNVIFELSEFRSTLSALVNKEFTILRHRLKGLINKGRIIDLNVNLVSFQSMHKSCNPCCLN